MRAITGVHRGRRGRIIALGAAAALAASLLAVTPAAGAASLPGGSYVVSFAEGVDVVALAKARGIEIDQRFTRVLNGFAVELTSAEATRLSRDSRVESVSPDITFEGEAQLDTPAPKTVEADKDPVRAGDGVTTPWSGPAVAVVDSGVNAHPDYNLVGAVGCVAGDDDQDGNGHGTGVSGFMAAYDNTVGMVGTAPGAPIYSVRVMDDKNVGTLSSIICGLDWVAQNAPGTTSKS